MIRTIPDANSLAERNLGLAIDFKNKYHGPLDRDDVGSIAYLGLIEASRNYDPDAGAAFSTYAWLCIHRKVIDESIRYRQRKEINGAGAVPSDGLEDTRHDDYDRFESSADAKQIIEQAIADLDDRDRDVLKWRFFDGLMMKEIAQRLGVTTSEGARQVVERAIRKLRSIICGQRLAKAA